jgi:hypothetical protein
MKNFASFQDFILSNDQTMAIEGGAEAVTTTAAVTTAIKLPVAKHDKIAQFTTKLIEVKASTELNAAQKKHLLGVITTNIDRFKAHAAKKA